MYEALVDAAHHEEVEEGVLGCNSTDILGMSLNLCLLPFVVLRLVVS